MQREFDKFIATRSIEDSETIEDVTSAFQQYLAERAAEMNIRHALAITLGQDCCLNDKVWLMDRRMYWDFPENNESELEVINQITGCDILLETME